MKERGWGLFKDNIYLFYKLYKHREKGGAIVRKRKDKAESVCRRNYGKKMAFLSSTTPTRL